MKKTISPIFAICLSISLIVFTYLVLAAPAPITSVVLNSTFRTNTTSENLTVYVNPVTNSTQRYFYNWYVNDQLITKYNVPMDDGGAYDIASGYNPAYNYWCYYNSSGGFNGKGAIQCTWLNYSDELGEMYGRDAISITAPELLLKDNFTISYWVKTVYLRINTGITIFGEIHDFPWSSGISSDSSNYYLFFGILNTSSKNNYIYDPTPISLGTWYHVVGTFRNGVSNGMKLYRNGNLVNSVSTIGLGNLYIGGSSFSFPSQDIIYHMDSNDPLYLDELLVINRTLTDAQVKQLYNSYTNPSYTSTYIHSSMLTNGETWKVNVVPNDNIADGTPVMSNNLTIQDASSCPSTPQNWIINLSTNPIINSICNLSGYNVTLSGTGNLTVNSTFYMKYLKGFSLGRRILMKPNGKLRMKVA